MVNLTVSSSENILNIFEASLNGTDNKTESILDDEEAKEVLCEARSNCLAVENVKFHVVTLEAIFFFIRALRFSLAP